MIKGRAGWMRATALAVVLASGGAIAAPAAAQDDGDVRIRKLEAEVRALQRKVFPGGDSRFFEPEISQANPPTTATPAVTSAGPVTDVLARMDALEASVQRLTAQVELNGNALATLSARVDALEASRAAMPAITDGAAGMAGTPAPGGAATGTPVATTTGGRAPTTTAPAAGPSPARLAAVQAIAKPQTDDAGDDEYSYGFRLWQAGFYPEAEQQLTMFLEKYPDHWRATWGRNLLGRAYLDDGKPRDAAAWFIKNYQADRNADRAPDSLLYLAESMIAMNDTNRACIALAEFSETYPAVAAGRLRTQFEANRNKVTCSN